MTKITMDQIKKLREETQIGMMDCKKALIEAEGDHDKAIEILRKKGAAVAAKRAGSETNNGNVDACISEDLKTGALVKIGCETDFSANTKAMLDFGKDVCNNVLKTNPSCIKDGDNCLVKQTLLDNPSMKIEDNLNDLIAKIGEKIEIADIARFQVEKDGIISSYIHPGSNIGVLLQLDTDKPVTAENLDKLKQLGKDICMQIVVTNPLAIRPEELDKDIVEKEKTLAKEQLLESGKPENIIDKILEGKMKKYYQDVCLLNQMFIKNDKITIQDQINQVEKDTGLKVNVKKFARFAIGK